MDISHVMNKDIRSKSKRQSLSISLLHLFSCAAFGGLIYLANMKSAMSLFLLVIFLLGTTLPILWQNKRMLIICLLVVGVAAAFPPLAPLAGLFVVWLFVRRIELILAHWRPMLAGLMIYVVPIIIYFSSTTIDYYLIATKLNISIDPAWNWPLTWAFIGGLGFNFTLLFLYKYGYDTKTALSLMGIVPIVLLALVLPFLKIPFEFEMAPIETGVSNNHLNLEVPPPPGYHEVDSHLRTLPDGIVENNLSYNGDSNGAPPPSGVKEIKSYIRSNPDGIIENNLSYKGESSS